MTGSTNGSMKRSGSSNANQGAGGAVYGLGFLGALVYFIQSADGFLDGAWGVVQALLWPAFFVYEALKAFGT